MLDSEIKTIHDLVGKDAFTKGMRYPKHYIEYEESYEEIGTHIHHFKVESERSYSIYDVEIREKKRKIVDTSCSCPQYNTSGMCKHIAACLIQYQDDIFIIDPMEKNLNVSKSILEQFYQVPDTNTIKLKKQLTLALEMEFCNSYYETGIYLRLKIGDDRLYNLNNKLNQFFISYETGNQTTEFGKNFIYNPNTYFFTETDDEIIQYLMKHCRKSAYNNSKHLFFTMDQLSSFLELFPNKSFTIVDYGDINSYEKSNPIKMILSKDKDYYKLSFIHQGITFLSNDFQFAIKNNTLYQIPSKISKILFTMKQNKLQEITFQEENLETFSQGILQIIKDNIELDKSIENKIILGEKPNIKIYLDLKRNIILCNIKLKYKKQEIGYFESTPQIARDEESENAIIETLLSYGFEIQENKIYMENIENIGEFLTKNLMKLAESYEVFTSNKIKETKVLTENSIRSHFSIAQDNIMQYSFDLGNIKNDEIINILETMKTKQQYYRLKSGDILDLYQNKDLKQLQTLINDMELSKKDLKNGCGTIPKYRAIYLDSIKKEKCNIIKTNNLFDELITKFNSYKNIDINLSNKEKKILRDYQETGVKWLYSIYKCGFGGILADEMGLGKSIQLIYFIKQILKEKKDAKVLIVAPTSLVYNWKNEFDKFGDEISYKVFAETKNLRKKELDNIENINVLITTYGLVKQDKEKYLNINFELIAIDEAQTIKNVNTQMTKTIKELTATTRIALTGTPIENSVLELWSIFDFIMPGYLANINSFQKKYNVKNIDEESLKILDTLTNQIKPFILRRRKKEVIKELPDKIENNIFINLNEEQKKLYMAQLEKTKKEMNAILETEGLEKGNFKILQLLTKLRQLCIDPKIVYENYQGGSAKIESLISLIEGIIQNNHKILLFTSYKSALNIVNQELTNHNISTYIIDGSIPSKKRIELVNKFNQDSTNVFLITLKAGGTGLNLTSADVVIHLDLWWNPQVENQATDRAHRIGQKNTVEVIKLICKGTIEERILQLQNKKKILSDKLIEGDERDQNIISKLTVKDIKELLSLDNEEEE